jgi:hypothetical protein
MFIAIRDVDGIFIYCPINIIGFPVYYEIFGRGEWRYHLEEAGYCHGRTLAHQGVHEFAWQGHESNGIPKSKAKYHPATDGGAPNRACGVCTRAFERGARIVLFRTGRCAQPVLRQKTCLAENCYYPLGRKVVLFRQTDQKCVVSRIPRETGRCCAIAFTHSENHVFGCCGRTIISRLDPI